MSEISLIPPPPLVLFDFTPLIIASARHSKRRHLLGVIYPSHDDWLVGVAFEEIDDHFLTDAGDRDRSPALTGPWVGDADPAGAVLVLLTFAIPVELHLHAAVLVRVNLFAPRADDDRGLAALHERLGSDARRAVGRGERDALEIVAVRRLFPRCSSDLEAGPMARHVTDRGQQVRLVQVATVVILERELVTGIEIAAAAGALKHDGRSRLFLQTDFGRDSRPRDVPDTRRGIRRSRRDSCRWR